MAQITTKKRLRQIYPSPNGRSVEKVIHRFETHSRRFIALSPFVMIGSTRSDGFRTYHRGGNSRALSLIEADHGSDLALRVAHDLVVYLRRSGGQRQYSKLLDLQHGLLVNLRRASDAVLADPTAGWSIPKLADLAGMTERKLSRRFMSERTKNYRNLWLWIPPFGGMTSFYCYRKKSHFFLIHYSGYNIFTGSVLHAFELHQSNSHADEYPSCEAVKP